MSDSQTIIDALLDRIGWCGDGEDDDDEHIFRNVLEQLGISAEARIKELRIVGPAVADAALRDEYTTSRRVSAMALVEIDRQRALGWPDFHPEDYCHRCGGINGSWSVDSDRFNAALGDCVDVWQGIVCVGCFIQLHERVTGLTCTWQLTPLTPFRPVENPDA